MTLIQIEQLKVMAAIGCEPHEKAIQQPLFFDLSFETDITEAAKTDSLDNTIDYTLLSQTIEEVTESKHFHLIETLADTVAETLMANYPLKQLTLKLSKPTAIKNAKNVSISLQRTA